MYDELVKRLRAQAVYLPEKFSKNAELLDVLMKAADAIEELQGRAKVLEKAADKWCEAVPKWIPVTENLPDRAGSYLCTVYGDSILENYVTICSYSCRPLHTVTGWFCPCGPRYLENVTNEVVAWMPLPEPHEPPKEE